MDKSKATVTMSLEDYETLACVDKLFKDIVREIKLCTIVDDDNVNFDWKRYAPFETRVLDIIFER